MTHDFICELMLHLKFVVFIKKIYFEIYYILQKLVKKVLQVL